MTVTLQAADAPSNPTTPLVAVGYEATRATRNIIHNVIGQASPSVTLRPAALRTGTLTLVYPNEVAAAQAVDLHARPSTFTLVDTELVDVNMHYVVAGSITRTLDSQSLVYWIVTVAYQEIAG